MSDVVSAPNLRARYDRASDVLYLTRSPGRPARSREEQPGLVWRYDADHGGLIGLTIIDFASYWAQRRPELVARIAERFALPRGEASKVLDEVG